MIPVPAPKQTVVAGQDSAKVAPESSGLVCATQEAPPSFVASIRPRAMATQLLVVAQEIADPG